MTVTKHGVLIRPWELFFLLLGWTYISSNKDTYFEVKVSWKIPKNASRRRRDDSSLSKKNQVDS